MTVTTLKTLARQARAPIGWMLLALLLYGAYGHRNDHAEFHTMVRWVNQADQEIRALKKQIAARPAVTP